MSARQEWIGVLHLILVFLLTPVIILIWLWVSFNIVTWNRSFDGPAGVVLGLFLSPAVGLMFCSEWGLDLFLLLAKDSLKFRAIALPTVLVALINGLLIYLPARPWGYSSFAPALGGLSTLGVIVSALCFYFIGVWRTVPKN